MTGQLSLGGTLVGEGQPAYVIAEIGINHNGDVEIAKRLIEGAAAAGCNAVKFQKRTPELCTPRAQWDVERDTPWGRMRYIDYRHQVELDLDAYREIDAHCAALGIAWTASCWDIPSVVFMEQFAPPFYKAASASLTDLPLLAAMQQTGRPLIVSTGMSTMEQIQAAVDHLGTDRLAIAHSTSSYPCAIHELNLHMLDTLAAAFPGVPIGYSGHETGLAPTLAAVAKGAAFIERHITLDRAMWGSDQAASVELTGLTTLVRNVRDIEAALGDGVKRVYDSELASRAKLRRVP